MFSFICHISTHTYVYPIGIEPIMCCKTQPNGIWLKKFASSCCIVHSYLYAGNKIWIYLIFLYKWILNIMIWIIVKWIFICYKKRSPASWGFFVFCFGVVFLFACVLFCFFRLGHTFWNTEGFLQFSNCNTKHSLWICVV